MTWTELSEISDFLTVERLKKYLEQCNYEEVKKGLNIFYNDMCRHEKVNTLNLLTDLMTAILLWKSNTNYQNGEISNTIKRKREEFLYAYEMIPIINQEFILNLWKDAFSEATENFETEVSEECLISSLSWKDVFETAYETKWSQENMPQEEIIKIKDIQKKYLA